MSFLDFLRGHDIDRSVEECHRMPGAVLLDVRTPGEFREGRIPGSRNLPLHFIHRAEEHFEDPDIPLFVYCHSGARSRQAVSMLEAMGYTNVRNIGGIYAYSGAMER